MDKLYFGNHRGMILSNSDSLGRCRIFVRGVYPEEYEKTPTSLPLAEPATPVEYSFGKPDENCVSGSYWPTGNFSWPQLGSYVWVFFEGGNHNYPVYFAGCPGGNHWASLAPDQIVQNSLGIQSTLDETMFKTVDAEKLAAATTAMQELAANEADAATITTEDTSSDSAVEQLLGEITSEQEGETEAQANARNKLIEILGTDTSGAIKKSLSTITSGITKTITDRIAKAKQLNTASDTNYLSAVKDTLDEINTLIATVQDPTSAATKLATTYLTKYQTLLTQNKDDIIKEMFPVSSASTDSAVQTQLAKVQALSKNEILQTNEQLISENPFLKQVFINQTKLASGQAGFIAPSQFSAAMLLLQLVSMITPGIAEIVSAAIKSALGGLTGATFNIVFDSQKKPTLQIMWGGNIEFIVNGDITKIQNGTVTNIQSGSNVDFSGPGTNLSIPFPISLANLTGLIEGGNPLELLSSELSSTGLVAGEGGGGGGEEGGGGEGGDGGEGTSGNGSAPAPLGITGLIELPLFYIMNGSYVGTWDYMYNDNPQRSSFKTWCASMITAGNKKGIAFCTAGANNDSTTRQVVLYSDYFMGTVDTEYNTWFVSECTNLVNLGYDLYPTLYVDGNPPYWDYITSHGSYIQLVHSLIGHLNPKYVLGIESNERGDASANNAAMAFIRTLVGSCQVGTHIQYGKGINLGSLTSADFLLIETSNNPTEADDISYSSMLSECQAIKAQAGSIPVIIHEFNVHVDTDAYAQQRKAIAASGCAGVG